MRDWEGELRPGDRFLDFQIVRLLGRGGVGTVYEIVYRTKRQALKIVDSRLAQDPAMLARTVREGEMLTRIHSPYIVQVHETGVAPNQTVWIRMELLDGVSLRQALHRSGKMSLLRVCAFLRTAAHALHQCHVLGLIHRDVKPENFMVVRDEDGDELLKLLDFGIAKLYGSDSGDLSLVGTPHYMAPEHWRRESVSAATDLYSLCVMGWELHQGCHPLFHGHEDPWQMMDAHYHAEPPHLSGRGMPREIAALVMGGLAKDPAKRPQDALVFAEAVWGAWRKVQAQFPDVDTYPGEPPKERIVSRPLPRMPEAARPLLSKTPPLPHAHTRRLYSAPAGPFAASHESNAARLAVQVVTLKMPQPLADRPRTTAIVETEAVGTIHTAPLDPGSLRAVGEVFPFSVGVPHPPLEAAISGVLPLRSAAAQTDENPRAPTQEPERFELLRGYDAWRTALRHPLGLLAHFIVACSFGALLAYFLLRDSPSEPAPSLSMMAPPRSAPPAPSAPPVVALSAVPVSSVTAGATASATPHNATASPPSSSPVAASAKVQAKPSQKSAKPLPKTSPGVVDPWSTLPPQSPKPSASTRPSLPPSASAASVPTKPPPTLPFP